LSEIAQKRFAKPLPGGAAIRSRYFWPSDLTGGSCMRTSFTPAQPKVAEINSDSGVGLFLRQESG
jgi:hypothetical protein